MIFLFNSIIIIRLRQAEILRLAGNDAYKNEKLPEAMLLYDRALYHCNFEKTSTSFTLTDAHRLQIYQTNEPIRVNCSLMMLKMGDYRSCIQHAKAITEDEENIQFTNKKTLQKLYYILSKAYYRLLEYDEAEIYALKAKDINENNIEVNNENNNNDDVEKKKKDLHAIMLILNDIKIGRMNAKKHESNVWTGKLAPKFIPTTTTSEIIEPIVDSSSNKPSEINKNDEKGLKSSKTFFLVAITGVILSSCIYMYYLYK